MPKKIKFGRFEIEARGESGPLVPDLATAPEFDGADTLEMLAYAASSNLPALLIGDTGTGKTSAIRYVAAKVGAPYRRVNLNGATTADELVGKTLIKSGATYWTDGVLTQAMREGWWLVLDELNAALPEVLFVLQSLLDDDRMIVLGEKEGGEIVRPHANFRLFATMNPCDGYAGTRDINRALLSRFPVVLNVDYPTPAKEAAIVSARTGCARDIVDKMVKVAGGVRNSYRGGETDLCPSTRDLLAWASLTATIGDPMAAMAVTLRAKAQGKDDKEALDTVAKAQFGGGAAVLSAAEVAALLKAKGSGGVYLALAADRTTGDRGVFPSGTVVHAVTLSVSGPYAMAHFFVVKGRAGGMRKGLGWNVTLSEFDGSLYEVAKPSGFDEEDISH